MKKFLALVLALVMTMSLVTISAGATDFNDDADISYEEAVAVMSDLKVVDGDTAGNFNPTNGLTRGAAAKIICNLILGPTTAAELNADTNPYVDVAQDSTFAGYIAYCQKEGIISGYADGTFKPAAPLTGYAFMKMLLGALGYDAAVEGYTGANWSINVAKQAIGIGLNAGLKSDFNGSDFVTREEAMLYAFNTMKATMVDYDTTITIGDITIAGSNEYDVANNAATETIKNDNKMQFAEKYFSKLVMKTGATDEFGRPAITWVNNKTEVGTYVDYTTLAASYTAGVDGGDVYSEIGSAAAKFDVLYWVDGKLDKTVSKAADLNIVKGEDDDLTNSGNGVLSEVYVDTDSEVVTVVTVNTYLAEVIADYNAKKEYVSVDVKGHATSKIYLDDVAGIEDLKADDMILVNIADDVIVAVQNAEMFEDSAITKYKTGSYYVVDGTQYDKAANLSLIPTQLTAYNKDALEDYTYNLYFDQYGYVIGIEQYSGTAKYLFLVGYDTGSSALTTKTADANVIFTDGTMAAVELDVYASADNGVTISGNVPNHNTWYKYSEDDGVYTLDDITNTVTIKYTDSGYASINCENVRLKDATNTAWGNDDSVYITVDTDAKATDKGAAITKVFETYTGVQDIDLTVDKTLVDDKSTNNNDIDETIWAVYDAANGYIIAAIVRGEDTTNSTGYAYAVKGAQNESFDGDAYFWEFQAVVAGEVETLTLKSEYKAVLEDNIDLIVGAAKVGTPALLKLTYDKDGYVIGVSVVDATELTDGDKVYSNYNWDNQHDVDPDKFTAYEVDYSGVKNLTCSGRTLYTHTNDVGLTLAAGAPVVVLQKDEDGDLSVEEYSTIAAAIDALEDSTKFTGVIAADLNDKGTAEWIVISSDLQLTAAGSSSGSSSDADLAVTVAAGVVTVTGPSASIDDIAAAIVAQLSKLGYEEIDVGVSASGIRSEVYCWKDGISYDLSYNRVVG